ncbi:MAG: helix-turn-helix domain-containing protein [Candidatus Peregrinibacteria bacterium]
MPIDILQSFGLSKAEAELYELLLPLGDVPMAAVTRVTGRHPQSIYRLVDQLVAKGLVISEVRQHRRHIRAEDPRVFEQKQAERLRRLRESLPALRALQERPQEAVVRIERGPEAVRNLRRRAFSALGAGETYYILSASGSRFYEIMGDAMEKTERLRIRRKVRKKMLAFESQRALLTQNEVFRTYVEMRYLPETFPVPSSTNIYGNVTAIQIWSEDPIVILMESREVAQSYKDYFETLWKMGRG